MSAKHVKALMRARERIESRDCAFVCFAINDIGLADDIDLELRQWIADSIYPHMTVNSWLRKRGIVLDDDQMREYRLAWIDQMIPIVREWK